MKDINLRKDSPSQDVTDARRTFRNNDAWREERNDNGFALEL